MSVLTLAHAASIPVAPPATEPAVEVMQVMPSLVKHGAWIVLENVEVASALEVMTPVLETEKSVVVLFAVEDEITNKFEFVSLLFALIENFAHGVEVPIPILPFCTGDDDVAVTEPE